LENSIDLTLFERIKLGFKEYFCCYLFILVPLIVFSIFTLYPLVMSLIMSFQEYNVMGSKWIGLANYKAAITNPIFWKAMKNTVIYTVFTVPVNILISFILSVLIFQLGSKAQTFFKASFYLPAVTSGVVMSLVWLWMFDPQQSGFFNMIMKSLGLPTQMWLASSRTALPSLIVMTYIGGHGSSIILYLAALGSIPKSLYEAADIDHASWLSKARNITWPLLKPTTLYMLIMGVIGSFQVFMSIYLMTSGGPNYATTTIGYLIFDHAFTEYNFGLAAAESFILGVIIVTISVIQFKYFSSDVQY
jgi:multiple sugar transport system permease protein